VGEQQLVDAVPEGAAPPQDSAELAVRLAQAHAALEELRPQLQGALAEVARLKSGWASLDMRLNEVKQTLAEEARKRQSLERWQADMMHLHFSLLETRDELWINAKRFDLDEFRTMFQTLCSALKPLGRLLVPDIAPTL
jgi:chromosome segregation ATPase